LNIEYDWKNFQEMLKKITKQFDALDSLSKKWQNNQIVNKCEKALESDATKERDILDEIEQQLNSVSLSKQKIKKAKKYKILSWIACYNDLC